MSSRTATDILSEYIPPIMSNTTALKTVRIKKLNRIIFLLEMFFSEAQKNMIAVSKENIQIMKRYCQRASSKFMLAIPSAVNFDVYNGIRIKETDFAATLLSP